MAYLKYKELTKYFNFFEELDMNKLPEYVTDYIFPHEKIIGAYRTSRDKGIFTDRKMLLFDVTPFSRTKQIHTIPYNSISTIAILFKGPTARILVYVDSGYPLTLKFVGLTATEKTKLRIMYNEICKKVVDR